VTLDEARDHIGDSVVYTPTGRLAENGVITGVSRTVVFVKYDGDPNSKGTRPEDLALRRKPSPMELWKQAGGGTGDYDQQRYRDLMHEHGHLLRPGDDGYEQGSRTLACGWQPGQEVPGS